MEKIVLNRNKFTIIENILTLTRKGQSKTKIMQNANLNYVQSMQYLDLLLELEFLKLENEKKQTYYKTTRKGFMVLHKISELFNIIEPKVDAIGNELSKHKFSLLGQICK